MKIVFPMQLGGDGAPCEVASLDAFIDRLNGLKSGTFPLGRNRLWHGGIHLSKAGGWHASGAVRAMADGEIVAYRLAKQPAKATLESEQGQPREAIDLYTSPSFCLVRHRYEAGEQSKNRCTFYSLYMHIACENSYTSPQAARLVVKGRSVSTYEPVPEMVHPHQFRLKRRVVPQGNQTQPLLAIEGAEVKLATPGASPSHYLNHRDESHPYHLVSYVSDPGSLFYIAASQLQEVFPQKPAWMTPPESKPARYLVPHGSWLRQTASSTNGSYGLPAGSEVEVARDCETVTVNGIQTLFYKARVFKTGDGRVTDSAGQVMTNASKGTIGWLAGNRRGNPLPAEPSTPVMFEENAPVVNRSDNPIPVQAGEVIGHWGEHQLTKTDANGLEIEPDSKAVHFEVFVAESDKRVLEDCINNQARLTTGQGYLLLKAGEPVTTYRLTSDNRHSYHDLAQFGPLVLPLAVKESDIISHGANNFVKVRERTAAVGELAGEYVLLSGDTQLVSQHDWAKLGVKLIDGSSDPDGFLDKADTEGKEGGEFFSALYDKLVTDRDSDGTLSGDDIKAALADAELAGKLRRLFIKHESEWIQRESWPRLEQELINKPNLYKYAMQVHKNMAWINDARDILGDTKHWFIHPAGMMGLVGDTYSGCSCGRCLSVEELRIIVCALRQIDGISSTELFNDPRCTLNNSDRTYERLTHELNAAFNKYNILTCIRRIHFLAQVFHESDRFRTTTEYNASNKPYAPYVGRGLIQLTHSSNYNLYDAYVDDDIISNIEIIANELFLSVDSAGWFWRQGVVLSTSRTWIPSSTSSVVSQFHNEIEIEKEIITVRSSAESQVTYGTFNLGVLADGDYTDVISYLVNGGSYGLIERRTYVENLKELFNYERCKNHHR